MRQRWTVAVAAVTLLGAGCTNDSDNPDPASAEGELLAQRDAVAETARELVAVAHDVLGGGVRESRGSWEGCTSRFPEGYDDVRYTADVRLDARPGTAEDLGPQLAAIAERSGYAVEPGAQGRVALSDGSVTAELRDVPEPGAEGDVLIRLAGGPCVDVPQDDWRDWLSREDPGPRL